MTYCAESYVHQGYRVRIFQDEDAPSPREEFDNLGEMVCWHRKYILGDKKLNPQKRSPQAFLWDLVWAYEESDILEVLVDRVADEYRTVSVDDLWPLAEKFYVIAPCWLYDHGRVSMSRGSQCMWDSGQVGFQYISLRKLRETYGVDLTEEQLRELGKKVLDEELEAYDQYLRGDVYGYVIEDADGIEVGSCWGYLGFQYAKDSANEVVEALMESRARADWEDEMEKQSRDAKEEY
jgi:hypothetical protein